MPAEGSGGFGNPLQAVDMFFELEIAQLAGIKGKFLLSLNDARGVREVFGAFVMKPVDTPYTVAGGMRPKRVSS